MKEKAPPKKRISDLEARTKRLEQDEQILNRAIDIADDMLGTDI
ncbi:MAG TPA: hypothetical protein PLW44_12720 [Chitinophagales bacterium]|nr:hypothetical protein [Chitinophagales bacterium]